jgi:hypothetical protein
VSLLNGSGYLLYSALLGYGDWQVVIAGLQPAWAWRIALGIAGITGYAAVVWMSSDALARAVKNQVV